MNTQYMNTRYMNTQAINKMKLDKYSSKLNNSRDRVKNILYKQKIQYYKKLVYAGTIDDECSITIKIIDSELSENLDIEINFGKKDIEAEYNGDNYNLLNVEQLIEVLQTLEDKELEISMNPNYLNKTVLLEEVIRKLEEYNMKIDENKTVKLSWGDGSCAGFCCDGYSTHYELSFTYNDNECSAELNEINVNNIGDYEKGEDDYEETITTTTYTEENIEDLIKFLNDCYISKSSHTSSDDDIMEKIRGVLKVLRTINGEMPPDYKYTKPAKH